MSAEAERSWFVSKGLNTFDFNHVLFFYSATALVGARQMMVDGISGVWAASVLQQGEQSRAHRAREGSSRELRSRGAESRAVAWGGRRARSRSDLIETRSTSGPARVDQR